MEIEVLISLIYIILIIVFILVTCILTARSIKKMENTIININNSSYNILYSNEVQEFYNKFEKKENLLFNFDYNYKKMIEYELGVNKIKGIIRYEMNYSEITENERLFGNKEKPLKIHIIDKNNGEFALYYVSGITMMTGTFVNGEIDGLLTKYGRNGKILELINYKNGLRDGQIMKYNENHQLIMSGNNNDGKYDGEVIYYYPYSKSAKLIFSLKKGLYDGKYSCFFSNRNLMASFEIRNGYLDSNYIQYDSEGRIIKEINYLNDIVIGVDNLDKNKKIMLGEIMSWVKNEINYEEYLDKYGNIIEYFPYALEEGSKERFSKELILEEERLYSYDENTSPHFNKIPSGVNIIVRTYYQNGKQMGIYCFNNGQLDGDFKVLDLDGNKICEGIYRYGSLHGELIKYNQNGKIYSKDNFINGKKEGNSMVYFHNGIPKITAVYVDNVKEGVNIEYYPNGALKSKYFYLNGIKEGEFKIFYSTGKLLCNGIFKNGYLTKSLIKYNINGLEIGRQNMSEKYILNKERAKNHVNSKYSDAFIQSYIGSEIEKEDLIFQNNSNSEILSLYKLEDIRNDFYIKIMEDKFTGKKEGYYFNGNLKFSFSVYKGLLYGDYSLYYPSGSPYIRRKYKHSMVAGFDEQYQYEEIFNGNIRYSMENLYYEREKLYEEYFFQGKLLLKGKMRGLELNGDFRIYDIYGNLFAEGVFQDGKLCDILYIYGQIKEEIFFSNGIMNIKYLDNSRNNPQYAINDEQYVSWDKSVLYNYLEISYRRFE